MRIGAIRGANLASLRGTFAVELDQPPLSQLGLFAIHGPVGAGKSTLLDALCLALYGRTPRLSGRGGVVLRSEVDGVLRTQDPRTLVRRGASHAFAEVDFTGIDGVLYRARWSVHRARGKDFGRLQPEVHTLIEVANERRIGEGVVDVRAEIAARLRLSFDEFCRSVLLAQGGFQSFLLAPPSERAALLEKMTGTELYSRISRRTFERAREETQKKEALEAEVDVINVLDDDARVALEERLTAADVTRAQAGAAFDAALAQAHLGRARRELEAALVQARAQQAEIARGLPALEARCERARELEHVRRAEQQQLQPLLDEAAALDQALQHALSPRAAVRLEHKRTEREALAKTLQAQEAERGRALLAEGEAEAALQKAGKKTALLSSWSWVEGELRRLADDDVDLAGALAFWRSSQERLAQCAEDNTRAVAAADSTARALEEMLPHDVGVADLEEQRRATWRALAHSAATARDELRGVLAGEERALFRLERTLEKEAERALLVDGDPCPLCGSAEHPYRGHAQAPGAQMVATQRAAVAEVRESLDEAIARAASARARGGDGGVPDYLLRQSESALQARAQRLEEAAACAARYDKARAAVDDAAAEAALAGQEHAYLTRDVEVRRSARTSRVASLTRPFVEAGLSPMAALREGADIRFLVKQLRAEMAALAEAQQAQERAAALVSGLVAQIVATQADDAALAQEEAALAAELDVLLAEEQALRARRHALLPEPVAAARARLMEAWEDARDGLDQARTLLAGAKDRDAAAAAIVAERAGRLADLGTVDASESVHRVEDKKQARDEAEGAYAQARAALARDDEALARFAALEPVLVAARERAAVWAALADVIGSADGSRFRLYAQGLTLDALVAHANVQLVQLAPRYRLARARSDQGRYDLELVVIDSESGDEIRATHTLSGGETFLVSLSLALGLSALSANEAGTAAVESLFIDEGFSTLDAETLETALTAFETLRASGRQIGVISHVPALVERIGAQVRVTPMGGGASKVTVSAA